MQSTLGQMVNLLSNDVGRFETGVYWTHYLWIGPIQLVIIMFILWTIVGPECCAGIVLLIVLIPIQGTNEKTINLPCLHSEFRLIASNHSLGWLSKQFSKLRSETALKTDERIRLMNEIIQGIKVIKMYAWEHSFAKMIQKARKAEMKVIQNAGIYKAINEVFNFTNAKIVMVLFLLTLTLNGKILTAEKAFLSLAFFNVCQISLERISGATQMLSEVLISIQRIQQFLELEELGKIRDPSTCENMFQ